MEIGIHLIKGLAETIETRDRLTANPLVSCVNLGAEPRHLGRDASAKGVARNRLQHIPQQVVHVIYRRKGAGDGIKRSEFGVAFQFLSKGHAPLSYANPFEK